MNKFKKIALSLVTAVAVAPLSGAVTLYTCGDSTMANYATDGSTPTRGWGQYFGAFFNSDITVINRGKGGMDVHSFINSEAYWPTIKKNLQPGDYVLLQFGHNDEKNGGMDGYELRDYYLSIGDKASADAVDLRGSVPSRTYVDMLRSLINEIRAKGANPILCTPICRMYFANGDIRRNGRHDLGDNFDLLTANGPTKGNKVPADDHSMDYPYNMIALAKEMNVPYIDLTQNTRELFSQYGDEKCHSMLSDGAGSTHLNVAGAALIARRCAEEMVKKNILADYIVIGDADLTIQPSDGNLGDAYPGNVLTKEFTITGFGLQPADGNVTISVDGAFEISPDKNKWGTTTVVSYANGVAIGSFYVRTTLNSVGTVEGSLTASAGNSTVTCPLKATAADLPGNGKLSVIWPLTADATADAVDDGQALPMANVGLDIVGYNNGVDLRPAAGWPAGDIDESPTRYIEFAYTVPEGKIFTVSELSAQVGGIGTSAMNCHVSYSSENGFGNPQTFYSPQVMADGVMNSASTCIKKTFKGGETIRMRIYPWTTEAQSEGTLRVADVRISGYVENTTTAVALAWTLDKGVDNPVSAETTSSAFSFTGYAVGSDLKVTGTGKPLDRTGTMYQPTVNNQPAPTPGSSISFSMRPKKGINFVPKKVSFFATRNGTDGGLLNVSMDIDGHTTELATGIKPERNNSADKQSFVDIPVEGTVITDGTLTFSIGIYSLGNTKTVTIHDFIVEGEVSGKEIAVESYTITAVPSIAGAGTVTVSPNSPKIDKGLDVTVSATENFGYRFDGWSENGKIVSTDNPYTFVASRNLTLVAEYTKLETYPLNLNVAGGANNYMVTVKPAGEIIDGVPYYPAGTEITLTASNNRILTFTNWEDNTTTMERSLVVDGPMDITANYSADDFIVGWDFVLDDPNTERAADFKAETDNAGKLSLHNEAGQTQTWLSRGSGRGDENGRYGARIWKNRSEKYFFEISFGAAGYSNLRLVSALSCSYNTYSRFFVQYSLDGKEYTTLYETSPGNRSWNEVEFDLPEAVNNAERVYIRWYPDFDSELVGNATDYDGLCISGIYVLASTDVADDTVAPVLTAVIPADGANGISVAGSVVLTYDEKIIPGQGYAILGGKSLTPTVAGKTAVFAYNGLDYNTDYEFIMDAGVITDRAGNPAPATSVRFTTMNRVEPEARLFDAVVDLNGEGDYTSLQAAVDAAPADRAKPWLIFVKNGRYHEHIDIPSNKPHIHITGQDREKTVIYDDRLSGGENAVHVSIGATVVVNSNDCMFENITIENSYGHEKKDGPQALALNTIGDRVVLNNVALLSYQDTWITTSKQNHRAYVNNSFIEGAVDFIYNGGDLYCQNTILYITRKSGGYIVAPNHTADTRWGYVFRDCRITAPGVPSETSVWLGRPWHGNPKTVFLNTIAEVTIPAAGWAEHMGGLPVI